MLTLLSTNAAKPLTAAYKTSGKMKSSLPILNHIRIYTDNGCLMAESTDLETASREKIAARVDADIDICVPARAFKDWMQVIAKNYKTVVKMWVNYGVLYAEITADGCRSKTSFVCLDSKDFPQIDQFLPA